MSLCAYLACIRREWDSRPADAVAGDTLACRKTLSHLDGKSLKADTDIPQGSLCPCVEDEQAIEDFCLDKRPSTAAD